MEERVAFESQGLKLARRHSRIYRTISKAGQRRPACLVLHGFGSNKGIKSCISPATLLAQWVYVALRFDMRGCGESEGSWSWSLRFTAK